MTASMPLDHSVINTKQALAWASEQGLDAIDGRVLLLAATGLRREWLLAHDDQALDRAALERFAEWVRRRAAGQPVAQLTGQREFYGRSFMVNADVLIPRPETELLVECVLQATADGAQVLDLGTGSGAIAVTLAAEQRSFRLIATDRSTAALTVAAINTETHAAGRVQLIESDWFSALASAEWHRRFDWIVSNPPYIAAADRHLQQGDLRFEPIDALTDGDDGLTCLRRIIGEAPAYLKPGGWLAVEQGYDQAEAVRGLFVQAGFSAVESRRDLVGIERVTLGRHD